MRSFILLTFLFLGLGFYELSGGSDFVPETRPGAELAAVETTTLPETVTRDDSTDPADLNALPGVADRLAQPLVSAAAQTEVETAVADAIATAIAAPAAALPEAVASETEPVLVSLAAPRADTRYVDASSLNVRAGPSTNDSVVGRLGQGQQVNVISELDDGWALVRFDDTGSEGWVAARFLVR